MVVFSILRSSMRDSYNGSTFASQARSTSSILVSRTSYTATAEDGRATDASSILATRKMNEVNFASRASELLHYLNKYIRFNLYLWTKMKTKGKY